MSFIDVSTRFTAPILVMFGVLFVLGLWLLIAPDLVWRVFRPFTAWQYQDGHRLELSDAGRLWHRFSGMLSIAIAVAIGIVGINWSADSRVETARGAGVDTVYLVGDPVASPGCTVRIVVCLRSEDVFPIAVTGYRELRSTEDWPADLRRVESLPPDADLLLYVEDRFFPTHLVLSETSDQVTVSVYGKCAPYRSWEPAYGTSASECPASRWTLPRSGIVPVPLAQGPPGGRSVVDGAREAPIEPVRD